MEAAVGRAARPHKRRKGQQDKQVGSTTDKHRAAAACTKAKNEVEDHAEDKHPVGGLDDSRQEPTVDGVAVEAAVDGDSTQRRHSHNILQRPEHAGYAHGQVAAAMVVLRLLRHGASAVLI